MGTNVPFISFARRTQASSRHVLLALVSEGPVNHGFSGKLVHYAVFLLSLGLEQAVLLLNPSIISTHSLASGSAQGISCLMFCPLHIALKWSLGLLAVWERGGREVSRGVCVCARVCDALVPGCVPFFMISALNPPGVRYPESKEASLKHYDPAHNYPQMSLRQW